MKKIYSTVLLLFVFLSTTAQTPGNSLNFDGTNDYVSTNVPSALTSIASQDFTLETWIKIQSSSFSRIVFLQNSTSDFFSLTLGNNNEIYFYINTVGQKTTTFLPINTWTHVAITWSASTNSTQVYINGILETTIAGGSSSKGTNGLLTIGSRTDGNQYFTGELDELRIWNEIRSACEIEASMVSEYTTPQSNLLMYYNFNQGTAGGTNTGITNLPDISGSNNGLLNNFALSGSFSNWLSSSAGVISANLPGGIYFTDTQNACKSFTWIDGITYTEDTDTAKVIYPGAASNGCDSVIQLDLEIITVEDSIYQTQPTLTAVATGATFQWLDCNNGNAIIAGETNAAFTANTNGNYAVEITQNGCTDTSNCVNVANISVKEFNHKMAVSVYPNPTNGRLFFNFGTANEISIRVLNSQGQVVFLEKDIISKNYFVDLKGSNGVYFIEIKTAKNSKSIRVIKSE